MTGCRLLLLTIVSSKPSGFGIILSGQSCVSFLSQFPFVRTKHAVRLIAVVSGSQPRTDPAEKTLADQ